MTDGLSRRDLLKGIGAVGGAAAIGGLPRIGQAAGAPVAGKLGDIEHIIISIQENRAFDHYFGTYRGVRGFDDRSVRQPDGSSIFAQKGYPSGPGGRLLPFHIDTNKGGDCTPDVDHGWPAQHASYDGGRNDRWVPTHIASNGAAVGPSVMGYYTRADLPYYHALADNFTICDHYHCSVIGPTDPNHLYNFSGTLDPEGKHGGPQLSTDLKEGHPYAFTWTTMPERLQAAGVSWKLYTSPDSNAINNVLYYFKNYETDPNLIRGAFGNTNWPADFAADVAAGTLPQVSWILSPAVEEEHPASPITLGEFFTSQVIDILTSNPAVYAKSVLILTYDENGGFFDHVPPPAPPPGTPGEYLTGTLPAAAGGFRGPVGLGFRVPTIIVSPFSRGGFVASDVFDHTSTLLLVEKRFGVEAPNLSKWRRETVGDMTSALNFCAPDASIPTLPAVNPADPRVTSESCLTDGQPYPVPAQMTMPTQEPGKAKRPSGICEEPRARTLTITPASFTSTGTALPGGAVVAGAGLLAGGVLAAERALRRRKNEAVTKPGR